MLSNAQASMDESYFRRSIYFFLEIRTRKKVSYVDAPLHKKTMNEHSNYSKEQKRKCHTHQDAFIHSFALYYTSSWKQEPYIDRP